MKRIIQLLNKVTAKMYVLFLICIILFFSWIHLCGQAGPIQLKTVLTGSMAEIFPQGSLLVVKDETPEKLRVGDIISFEKGNETVSHRITKIDQTQGQLTFQTKGDSNQTIDQTVVFPKDITGKIIFSIPKLGRILSVIQSPRGKIASILTIIQLLLFDYFVQLLFTKEKNQMINEEICTE
ncbi:signal peptidase I [Enterococcus sp. 5H]|uniref:signal peptidase I n=1 Tax=Enterococcus sp. 5H TaxID=1229490 RepID=UPI0023031EE5|nr:signal peptidase I [Enterococcus sp. 5H]